MKNHIKIILFLLLVNISATAQLKLGTNPTSRNTNSLLELEGTTKGFLLSRVSLTSTTSYSPLTAAIVAGFVVYNTNATVSAGSSSYPINSGGTGLYYWDGSGWVAVKMVDANARANHTGTQTAATISDFSSAVAATASVTANTAKVTNATHTGDVTGSGALTIASNVVDNTKLADVATQTFKGRNTASTGNPEDLSVATAKTMLGLTGTNTGDQTITLTGDVTGSGTGSFATSIANNSVTLADMAQVATSTILGRSAAGTGNVEVLSASSARSVLGATTVGSNLLTLTNPSAIRFLKINADNTATVEDAATFRTSIGAGTSSTTGTVTSVAGTGTVSGLNLSGTVTSTGNLTLGGTLNVTASNFSSQTANTILAAPNGSAGVPTFRTLVAADIPTLNQNTTGTSANVTGTVAVANGGTGTTTAAGARTNLGATTVGSNLFTLTNPTAVTFPRFNANNTVSTLDAATFRSAIGAGTGSGTVTSVAMSVPAFLSVSGSPVTGSGTLAINYSGTALPIANGGTGSTTGAGLLTGLTSGYIPKATGNTSIGNSNLYDDGVKVGIGTTTPEYLLEIKSPTVTDLLRLTNLTGQARLQFGGTLGQIDNVSGDFYLTTNSPSTSLIFRTNLTEKFRIKSNGAVKYFPMASAPSSPEEGDVYMNSTTHKLQVYTGSAWADLH